MLIRSVKKMFQFLLRFQKISLGSGPKSIRFSVFYFEILHKAKVVKKNK